MSLPVYNHPLLRVQYRRSWADAWTWDTGTVGIGRWKKAGGNQVGSAIFTSYNVEAFNREASAPDCPLRRGWFVRIVSKAASGGVPTTVYWTGWLAEMASDSLGAEDLTGSVKSRVERVTWTALGLGGLLAQIDLHRVFRGCGMSSAGVRACEARVRFGWEKRTDDELRSSKRILYPRKQNGAHTLHNLLVALLHWHLYEPNGASAPTVIYPTWPVFEIGGLTAALNWKVRDVELGGDLYSAIAGILHPRRGLFCTVEPSTNEATPSAPVTITVQTFAPADITINLPEGGTQTIPANPDLVTLDGNLPHRRLVWAPPPTPRRLTLHGERDVRIVSLRWSRTGGTEDGALARRWDSADDANAGKPDVAYSAVYRDWAIREGWDGSVKGTSDEDLPHRLSTAGSLASPDSLHGAGGLTGALTTSGSDPFPELGVEILDQIPMASQATNASFETKPLTDWLSATSGVVLDETAAPLRPMAFVHHRATDTWEKINVQIAFPDARTVRLGSGPADALKIKGKLALATDDLVITCAIVLPSALAVSYIPAVAADAETPIGADRKRDLPWAERIVVQKGTVCGLTLAGAPTAPTADRTVRDDVGQMRGVLAMARASGERSAGGVYEDRAELDATIKPGQLVTQASLKRPTSAGAPDPAYVALGYVVTSVEYDPTEGPQIKTKATLDIAEIDMRTIA